MLAAAVALSWAWPAPARAYRPFDSTDASVADRGELELELGPAGYLARGPDRALVAPSLVVNWGVAERWEAVLEGRQLVALGDDEGRGRLRVDDTSLAAKRVLRAGTLQGRAGPSVATEVAALLPTVHDEPGVGAEWILVVSQRWPELTTHLNVAGAWTRAHQPGAFLGLILEVHDAWTVRPVAELFVEAERGEATTLSGLLGVIGRVREGLSWDVAVRRARAGGGDTTEVRVGLTCSFAIGYPR